MSFTPFAMDVYGQIHETGMNVLERLATYGAANLEEAFEVLLRKFVTKVEFAMARTVASMIMVRGYG
jgi:hypothetical protein